MRILATKTRLQFIAPRPTNEANGFFVRRHFLETFESRDMIAFIWYAF